MDNQIPPEERVKRQIECGCGSGLPRYPLMDARGIFVAYICAKCEFEVKGHYRPDIFTDSNYWTDEPVDPE